MNPILLAMANSGGGGGGGGVTALSGTDVPDAAVGNDGDIYLLYYVSYAEALMLPENGDSIFMYNAGPAYYARNGDNPQIYIFVTGTKDVYFVSATNSAFSMSNSPDAAGWKAPSSSGFTSVDATTGLYCWLRNDMDGTTINAAIPHVDTFRKGMDLIAEIIAGSSAPTVVQIINNAYVKVSGAWQALFGSDIRDVHGAM